MSELALYRKYRSQSFDEVVGQPHIVTTLTNALAHNRVSHAYLLTGPRGVGKTSVARLLARAVNCVAENPSSRPCNNCEVCQIPLGANMDIIEIDAASNRRIDEIRDLRDKINLAPARSRYKIYIIDEVHMLTTEAFNALLKTLEEPPAHAIFILATTEVHKLPETIVSRTQRFNFKALSNQDIETHLAKIAATEKIIIEPQALAQIAQTSRGGFRDAISLLDQVANTGTSPITADHLRQVLGIGDKETIDQLVLAMAEHQPTEALELIDELKNHGVQTNQVVMQLINRWREIMLANLKGSKSDELAAKLTDLNEAKIALIINKLAKVLQAALPEIVLETTVVELAQKTTASHTLPGTEASAPKVKPSPKPPQAEAPKTTSEPEPPSGDLWPKALMQIKAQNNSLYALLCSCHIELGDDQISITCRFSFHRDRLQEPKNRQIIETAATKVYGKTMLLVCQLENTVTKAAKSTDPGAELVSSALEILGGEIVDG